MSRFNLRNAIFIALIACLLPTHSMAGIAPPASAAKATACKQMPFAQITSLSQAAQAITCDNLDRRLIIVGDYHGSNEIPGFVERLIETASTHRPVRLGLEIEAFEQKPIQVFMESRGKAADRAALLHDGYWSVDQGRNSLAVVRLIEQARALRAQGHDVELFTMVPAYPGDAAIEKAGGNDAYWNRGLAESIQHELALTASGTLVIAFMGQAHAAFTQPTQANKATATDRLLSYSPYLVETIVHGQTRSCTSEGCGSHAVGGSEVVPPNILGKVDAKPGAPETVYVRLPTLTPSPPAKAKARKPAP